MNKNIMPPFRAVIDYRAISEAIRERKQAKIDSESQDSKKHLTKIAQIKNAEFI